MEFFKDSIFMKDHYFIVDCESDGLYGEIFSIAAVVLDRNFSTVDIFYGISEVAFNNIKDPWVIENIVPILKNRRDSLTSYINPQDLRYSFWNFYMKYQKTSTVIADFGVPVESNLFRKCVMDDVEERKFLAPYPLHELGTILMSCGIDPDIDRKAFAVGDDDNIKKHDPLDDCVMTAAILAKINKRAHNERTRNNKYRMFKNFMYNDLGLTKEDIRDWTKEAAKEVAREYVEHHFNEWDLKRMFVDYRNIVTANMSKEILSTMVSQGDYELTLNKKK